MQSLKIAVLLLLTSCATMSPRDPLTDLRASTDAAATSLRELVPYGDATAWQRIRKQRVQKLLAPAMRAAGVDAWVVFVRENDNDPLAIHVGGENAGGTAAIIFRTTADGIRSTALSPSGEATALRDIGLHDEVIAIDRAASVFDLTASTLKMLGATSVAVNSSVSRAAADGLSHTQRSEFDRALKAAYGHEVELRSSEEVVVRWLAVKLAEEVEILRRAALLTERLEAEAYATVRPGITKDSDVAAYLKARMRDLGVEDAWAPEQNPNVNSGPDRGHSHATDRVIQHGDVIQTDFGIKVGGIWSTDIQRFAYVLRPGESAPPAEMLARWENGREGNRIALAAMKPGVRGYDVDAAQRAWMKERGSESVPWSTGHPVGYWAHDLGPSLGGAQRSTPPAGDALRLLEPGNVFAFDGFFAWKLTGGETKTISVEEMAVITATGAEYLIKPQEHLLLVQP
jgi:Xaa-Pro dipeptidase